MGCSMWISGKDGNEKKNNKDRAESHGEDNKIDERTIDGDNCKLLSLKGVRLISPADNGFLSLDFEIPKPVPEMVVQVVEDK
ncbi:unnamed protein product [Ambrosiozyma monospora]|uniref:Unnamed protein product n=1 Tax=Ambrosiozyma monospora TaxID=43982 RepID=A0ACB5T803_AMBMO|nr:unnamed protein product [Ambrosiozyma monospora]